MVWEKSCGAVVFTREKGELRYLIIQMIGGHHGFPKGHMEPGETELETAKREVVEEVGLRPRFLEGFRAEEAYLLPGKQNTGKRVVYFLAEFENQTIRIQKEELRGAQLLPFEAAVNRLEFDDARRILENANQFLHR